MRGDFLRPERHVETTKEGASVFSRGEIFDLRLQGKSAYDSKEVSRPVSRLGKEEIHFRVVSLAFGDVVKKRRASTKKVRCPITGKSCFTSKPTSATLRTMKDKKRRPAERSV